MDFTINENQKMIIDMVRKFGNLHITPFVSSWDENQIFPKVEKFIKFNKN